MKKRWLLLPILFFMFSNYTFGQGSLLLPIASQDYYDRLSDRTFNFNFQSSGIKAAGMGGAYLAVADDPTALTINPAGMTQLQRLSFSVTGLFNIDSREYHEPKNSGTKILSEITPFFSLNSVSFAVPISKWNRQFVVGFTYRTFNQLTNFIDDTQYTYGGGLFSEIKDIKGGSYTISPSLAIEIFPKFAIGANYNFILGESTYDLKLKSPYADDILYYGFADEEQYAGSFVDISLFTAPVKWVSVGIIFTPSWKYTIDEKSESYLESDYSTETGWSYKTIETPADELDEFKIEIPAGFGIGAAVKPFSSLTLSFDYRRLNYSETKVIVNGSHSQYDLSDVKSYYAGIEHRVNFGSWQVPLRAGYYSNPLPNRDRWFNGKYLGNQIDYQAYTLGLGIYKGSIELDFAYEHGSQEMSWWKSIGDYFNFRNFTTTHNTNRVYFSLSYQLNLFRK